MAFELGDKHKTALLVMDMQNDIVHERAELAQKMGFAQMVKEGGIIDNIRSLLEGFRAAKMPVVHVVVDFSASKMFQMPHRGYFFQAVGNEPILQKGTWGGAIHEDLTPMADEPIVGKGLFSSFAGTNLHEVLRSRDVTQLVMAGVATDFVVDATSWSASDLGYNVIVISDGCCSNSMAAHEDALKRLAARADIVDSATLLANLH